MTPSLAAAPPISLGQIVNQVVSDGSTDTFTARASGETQPLTYSLAAGAPAGAAINPVTGVFTWTPTVPGVYDVTVVVTDDSLPPLTAEQTVELTVDEARSYGRADLQPRRAGTPFVASLRRGRRDGAGPRGSDGDAPVLRRRPQIRHPVPMVNGAAISPSFATLGAGVHYVAAIYSGDADYASIGTPVLTETIAKAPLLVVANDSARI